MNGECLVLTQPKCPVLSVLVSSHSPLMVVKWKNNKFYMYSRKYMER